ncbi:OmpH family outer membrane protein [Azospirillum sp. RWY-5-1]|uniref:OmpH family outer membrane protein n=1 Tax=Azospirillum oleiclasticum TaxID=2735135 RepID=A0ABX2TC67_9PROT|nr:OmpH family outer membrane protein [Azospirillum oleiclasticum]NYZ14158.1 OmpH family outer membrane protein [Azospirillum oleiclasticum]NYZ21642.1 OmpH family outer membrane protein [Azospirillum oleiclasticum]
MTVTTMRGLLAGAALAAALALPALPAAAQTAPAAPAATTPAPGAASQKLEAPTIMVVDVQKILQEAAASKGIQKAVETQRDTYQKEIAALEDKLRTAEQELRKQQTVLSADALAQRRRDFEKQVADVQRTVQSRKRALDSALNDSMGQVQKAMVEIIAEMARDKGANIVLARHQFVLVEAQLDVTDAVMDRLNKKLPKVAVTIPKQ